jgi:outer membrane protein
MIRRPLALALAFALVPTAGAHAEDLLQTYELARAGDPQLAAAESGRLATKEGAVQARAALLPQLDGSATYRRSKSTGPSTQTQFDPVTGEPVRFSGDSESTTNNRSVGLNVSQVLFDFG